MSDLSSEKENPIKPTIKIEHQILKEYSQSYYWGAEDKPVSGKVISGKIEFTGLESIESNDAKLNTKNCLRVFYRVRDRFVGHGKQRIDALLLGECQEIDWKTQTLILESIELFINEIGDIVSDIKLTFFALQKGNKESHSILEVEPMYITPEKLTRMSILCKFIDELIDISLKEHRTK